MDEYFDKERAKQTTKLFDAKNKGDLLRHFDQKDLSEPSVKAISLTVETTDKELKKFLIEERSRLLIERAMYYEAITLLEGLDYIDVNDIEIKLLTAECYIQLGRETKADKAMKEIEKILSEPPACTVGDVIALVSDFISNKSFVRALILLKIRSDMLMKSSLLPDVKLDGLFGCVGKMDKVVGMMLDLDKSSPVGSRTHIIALDYVDFMENILENLRTLECTDLKNKTLKLAICANVINSHYSQTHQHAKAIELLKNEIELLEKYFGEDIKSHRIYCTMLHNLGSELHNSGKFQEAEEYKMAALEAEKCALDYTNEEEKHQDVEDLEKSLRTTRVRLKS